MNNTPPQYRNLARGFSLVELLTVIAVIAIIAAILLPVLSGIRRSAQSSKCLNNLRQIGAAINLYAQDHHGDLPNGYSSQTNLYWNQAINKYMDQPDSKKKQPSSRVFFCPAEPLVAQQSSTRSNYIVNPSLMPEARIGRQPKSIYSVTSPSTTVLIADGTVNTVGNSDWGFYNQGGWSGRVPADTPVPDQTEAGRARISWRHNGATQVLFADGSAVSFSPGELFTRNIYPRK